MPSILEKSVAIALGANLENPQEMIAEGLQRLQNQAGLRLLASSNVYLTEPQFGPPNQNWYHNSAALFETSLTPGQVLEVMMGIEQIMGRTRVEHWGPRLIDLDLIFYGQQIICDPPKLFLPHPRMAERRFVLAPLAELAADWVHPETGQTVSQMLAALPKDGQAIKKLAPSGD